VDLNCCCSRYTHPSFFLIQGALAIVAVGPVAPAVVGRLSRYSYILAALTLSMAALSSYHSPSLKKVRSDLDLTLGSRTSDILAARCTHVAGDYWKVWPAVFHANLVLHEQGESRTVWGISLCSTPTRPQWQALPLEEIRVAVSADDGQNAETWLQAFHFPPMVEVERHPTIYVLRPAAVVSTEQRQHSSGGHTEHEKIACSSESSGAKKGER